MDDRKKGEHFKENCRKMWKCTGNVRKLLVKVADVHYNETSVLYQRT